MSYVTWDIIRYARTGDSTWSSTPITLSGALSPIVRASIGDGKDTFSFNLLNNDDALDDYFVVGDKISMSRVVDSSSVASSDLLISGIVSEANPLQNGTSDKVSITGVSYTETLMNALCFVSADGLTIPEFFQQALNSVEAYNENFKLTWKSSNPSLMSDNSTSFPVVRERWQNKSLLKLLEKYSGSVYTEDGNYFFYVNNLNELVWKRRDDDPNSTFVSTSDDYVSLKTKKDTKGVINWVIAKGGLSPDRKVINVRVDNAVSRAKHGFKPYIIISNNNTGRELMDQDGVQDNYPDSYPFTTDWKSSITGTSPTRTIGSTITVANNTEYNTAIKEEVQHRLRNEAKAFVNERKNGKLMVELVFRPGKGWWIGDVVTVTIPEVGKTNNNMRVQDVEITTTTDKFTLIEDVGTI